MISSSIKRVLSLFVPWRCANDNINQFLEYFFAEEDAKFFASLGFNCIR